MSDAVLDAPSALAQPVKARRRPLPLVIALVAVVLAALWGWRRYHFNLSHVTTDNAQVDGHITPIAPKVQAFVRTVLVEENQQVRAGDTLVVLDDRDLRVRLAQAEAELANARATGGSRRAPGQVQAQLAASEAQAQSTTAAVASAEAADRKARADLERLRGLAARGIVAAQQLDAAQAAFDAATANLEAARRQASAAAEQVHAFAAGVGAAAARIASAEAAVASARLQLGYTVLTAPVAGVIGRRAVEPGGLVQVMGRVAPALGRLYEFDAAPTGLIRQNLDIAGFARETALPLRPVAVVQEDGDKPPQDGLQRQWPLTSADLQKHHGYAFQWFALSALTITLYVWFQLIRPRRRRAA